MDQVNMLSVSPSYMLYYLPLIVAISLVYGATRHEDLTMIFKHSFGTARWITGFMAMIFLVMCVMDWWS